ncbi:UDP-N-acetylglucosamine--N-acetylmuramyl-(pentapeptide) pyrophosphoryl-undecaprenol N-acetylglucosamine transferase [Rubinisphaera margarita]|uniref:UDP-N-acetylglucosamine--N-acetylmuramyl- (pentapeptide) pyrophosphoryl-undecaprenol N-acetylglucosamine transferase n=1 Tax=Rubinisphaera margarita TaxID=2909586 RepID=UPI001EE81DB7|nr:UDP-N-acetylglucosamine--N-acetylmuramyl-(pentapeptide) pyrophosphoryl-undecaprenol N-acetylglucosamine transferase [Rubinisphaera margarita]MCG6156133.1 UDP-N-acetylglucosamine--N-acetylmuramyl-(pentapeptide) pyrophosphoryl-undecaprenol N-acetylglucosamine transferase [Rubinisphaera margarita]
MDPLSIEDEQSASPKSPALVFAGGGTGGHLYPGIAVAERWKEQFPDSRIVFIGTDRPVERRIVQANSLEHVSIPFEPPARVLGSPWKYFQKLRESNRIVRELFRAIQPDIMIGLGNYSSVPAGLIARRSRIPLVLLEQNSVPGRANRFLARFADHLCLTYPESAAYLPRKTPVSVTGNPLRAAVTKLRVDKTHPPEQQVLLITGGSQGARLLNELLIGFAAQCGSALKNWHFRHQAGSDDEAARIRVQYEAAQVSAEVRAYFDTPDELYENVTMAVSRAGATTLAELAWLRIPALIVPIANSVNSHQLYNAQSHARCSCSQVIEEDQRDLKKVFNSSLLRWLEEAESHSRGKVQSEISLTFDATSEVVKVISRILVDV